MIKAVLDFLGIPHEEGFSPRIWTRRTNLTDGWQQRALRASRTKYPEALLVFYINHLDWELTKSEQVFNPMAAATAAFEMLEDQLSQLQAQRALARLSRATHPESTGSGSRRSAGTQGHRSRRSARTWASSRRRSAASVGKLLNSAKQALEAAFDGKKARVRKRGSSGDGSMPSGWI